MAQKYDPLARFLSDVKSKNVDVRAKSAQILRTYVEAEAREMSSDNFTKFMNELNRLIMELVNSTHLEEKMGGIMVIGSVFTSSHFVLFYCI